MEEPGARAVDADGDDIETVAVDGAQHVGGGDATHLVFGGASAEEDGEERASVVGGHHDDGTPH